MCGGSFTGIGFDGRHAVDGLDEATRIKLLSGVYVEFEIVDPEITLTDDEATSADGPERPCASHGCAESGVGVDRDERVPVLVDA